MNAVKIYEEAVRAADHNEITLGEFEKCIEPLKDVEAVIRCIDCKYNGGRCKGLFIQYIACNKTGTPHKEDWFCADGERRDGDG